MGDDGDSFGEQVGLLHVVRSEQHRPTCSLSLEKIPSGVSSSGIHAGGGFVENDHFAEKV